MTIGIYCIRNLINNKVYIGQSQNIEIRWTEERNTWNINHYAHPLNNSFKKHGLHNFEFIIIEECSLDIIDELEIQWISFFDSCNLDKGYNLALGGKSKGEDLKCQEKLVL